MRVLDPVSRALRECTRHPTQGGYGSSGTRCRPHSAHRASPHMNAETVFETELRGLTLLHRGKVRDLYALDERRMLIVATDRLSAFDVVLPDPIPDKGRVLNSISNFWFAKTHHIVANHLSGRAIQSAVSDPDEAALPEGRA